ncbi:hypothetical protein J2D73_05705 [Acetobacter sacchari]|uniref:RelA/SpoT domain-containing protein n=1 Tax=Acetobacter sacchari TaxID=2661687 RepID=A0ABS3LTT0_9PROT|nr:hypothetical protein [Acetobacter sacchari]MBO1359291.1 hypothetical protein [Acetobacter sacchari]
MSEENTVASHVAQYEQQLGLYSSFSENLVHLLRSIINGDDFKIHVIEARVKTIKSFKEKLNRPGKSYSNPLQDIPDLCGCRIITYYADDVKKISSIITEEFDVIEEELSHQPGELEVDKFGYLSAHYIIRLGKGRRELTEWKKFSSLHAEIQIRTVIQHAWSAISHEMQYKQESSVPSTLQRRLYRIAGLFELADEEFVKIRDQKALLAQEAKKLVASGQLSIPLSLSNILEAIKQWPYMKEFKERAIKLGFDFNYNIDDENTVSDIYRLAKVANLHSINDLLLMVEKPEIDFLDYVWEKQHGQTSWTVSESFLFYLMMLYRLKDNVSVSYLVDGGWGESIARGVIDAIEALEKKH